MKACDSVFGRGTPLSNAFMWAGNPTLTDVQRIECSEHFDACNPGNIVWPRASFAVRDATIRLELCWK